MNLDEIISDNNFIYINAINIIDAVKTIKLSYFILIKDLAHFISKKLNDRTF